MGSQSTTGHLAGGNHRSIDATIIDDIVHLVETSESADVKHLCEQAGELVFGADRDEADIAVQDKPAQESRHAHTQRGVPIHNRSPRCPLVMAWERALEVVSRDSTSAIHVQAKGRACRTKGEPSTTMAERRCKHQCIPCA